MTSTTGKEEKELIRQMQFIKESRPFIQEVEALKELIHLKRNERFEAGKGLGALKAEANELKTKINALKKTQEQAQESRETVQRALDKINGERNGLRAQVAELRRQKDELREVFYRALLAFEREQMAVREIEWLQGLKARALEREEQRRLWEEEKAKRQEERKRRIEEAEKREEARRQRERDRLKEEEDRQRKWEEQQLARLDEHPYLYEIDLCDFLAKYCERQDALLNGRLYEAKGASEYQSKAAALKAALEQERKEQEAKRRQAIEEQLSKGKLMRANRVDDKASLGKPNQANAPAASSKKPVQ